MSELITKLNPALVAEAMQAPAVIYKNNYRVNLAPDSYKSHIYASDTGIGIIILNNSTISYRMFESCAFNSAQLMNITEIGNSAFIGCTSLTSITIPDSVTSIGEEAFFCCYSLTSVTIGNRVSTIGDHAFYQCTSLTSITIPDSVTSIGSYAFRSCTSLTNVTIGDGVTEIGFYAFQDCTSLTSVTIGNGVTDIGNYAFQDCTSLTNVTIPDSVTYIGDNAFSGCSNLTSVTIGNRVPEIRDFVFFECTSLTDIVIPDSVTRIGESAFFECGLTSVTIPKHVTYISDGAFNTCSQLSTIYCKASTPPDTIEDAGCLPYNSNLKIYIPINSLELYKNHEYWQSRVDALIETVFEDEVLESGTNIKTINGNSILGSGDITIEGGGGTVYTWSAPTDMTTGTVTPEEYTAIKEASQVYIEMEGVYYQALKMNAGEHGSLILSVPIIMNDITGTHVATGLCIEIFSDLTFSGSVFMVNIPTKTSQLTNDANFVTYANFEWDGSSEGIVTQEKFEELRNADIVIVKQQDGDMIAHTSKTSGGAVIFYYSTTMNNMTSSAMFIVMDHDYSWTCSTSQTTIPAAVTASTVSSWGFTKNTGTVTGVKINGNTQNPSNGVVDLGYVNKQLSTSTSSSMTLSPNIYYRNTNTSLSTLTITLGSVPNSNILNEYFVEFTTRDAGTTVSLPNSIKWVNGVAPTFENGKTYQISIVNNLGTCVKFG